MPLFWSASVQQKIEKLARRLASGQIGPGEYSMQVLRLDPANADALVIAAANAAGQNDWIGARSYLWQALEANAGNRDAWKGLAEACSKIGDEPDLENSLLPLVMRRSLIENRDPELIAKMTGDLPEDLQNLMAAEEDTDLVDLFMALSRGLPGERPSVTERLRPFRLAQHIIDMCEDGMSREQIDDLVQHGAECTPVLLGLLKGHVNGQDLEPREACAAAALLGEAGSPEAADPLLECVWNGDPDLTEAAVWAIHRLVARFPELRPKLRGIDPPDPDLRVDDFCMVPADEFDDDGIDDEEDASAPPETDDERISAMLLEFLKTQLPKLEMPAVMKKFFGRKVTKGLDPDDGMIFFDWLLHDFVLPSGQTLPEAFLSARHHRLADRDRKLVEARLHARYSVYEVQRVEPDAGVEVNDLLGGDSFFVDDVSISRQCVKHDCMLARTREEPGKRVFAAMGLRLTPVVRDALIDWVRRDRESKKLDWPEYLRANSHRMRLECYRLYDEGRKNLRVVTADGDEMEICTATFSVQDRREVIEALRDGRGIEEGSQDGEFVWIDPDNKRVLGNIRIGKTLVLECMSRVRLERGIKMMNRRAGDLIKEQKREYQDPMEVAKKLTKSPAKPAPEIPKEVQWEVIQKYMEQHYATWPDTPVPALSGLTPRQAAGQPDARPRLVALLRDFANSEEHKRMAGDAWYDINRVRRELGLEEE